MHFRRICRGALGDSYGDDEIQAFREVLEENLKWDIFCRSAIRRHTFPNEKGSFPYEQIHSLNKSIRMINNRLDGFPEGFRKTDTVK